MKHKEYSGRRVLIRYRGGALGEEPVEDHMHDEPVEIAIGTGQLPPGIDEALYEMEVGECRKVTIPCEEGFGRHDPEGVRGFPRSCIEGGADLDVGSVLAWRHPVSGRLLPARCVKATKDAVIIDYNHPLAGKDLDYQLELVSVLDD